MAGRAFILLCCHDKGDFPKGHSAQLFAILTDAHGGCQHGVGYEVPWAASRPAQLTPGSSWPASVDHQVIARSGGTCEEPLRRRLIRDEIVVVVGRKREYAIVNHLDACLQPRHPIDGPTFLADDDMRIGQRAAVEQVRRDHGVAAFERLAVDVLVGEQSPVGRGVVGRVQPDDDHVDVRLPASVRSPREGPMREGDLQTAMVKQPRPELRDLLALRNRVGRHEADPRPCATGRRRAPHVAPGTDARLLTVSRGRSRGVRCEPPAAGGNILASLDNFLAETVEGSRVPFDPHTPTPGRAAAPVNGLASAFSGCQQCHGSKLGLATDGAMITVDDLQPDDEGLPTNAAAVARIARGEGGRPAFHPGTWPNTGIGRLNLDGSRGSCTACHSRHDFSPRRARQPENCGKCHLGPDHPQKEIYEESKHGVAYRDLRSSMNLDADRWVLGVDYAAAPTCATCHVSGHSRNEGRVTHDPGRRISWTNRPPVSVPMDTDIDHNIVRATDENERRARIHDSATAKRGRMKEVCAHCHTAAYTDAFYQQYDDLVILYNEKFAKPGQMIMAALLDQGLRTPTQFDEEIEWTWFYLWHHEGRRARHGASMMAPDYTHWHGMYEVAERFYMELIPQAREIVEHAAETGQRRAADAAERHRRDSVAARARLVHRGRRGRGGPDSQRDGAAIRGGRALKRCSSGRRPNSSEFVARGPATWLPGYPGS